MVPMLPWVHVHTEQHRDEAEPMTDRLPMAPPVVPPCPNPSRGSQAPPGVSNDWGTTSIRACVWVPQYNHLLHEWVRVPTWDPPYWGPHRTGTLGTLCTPLGG